LKVLLEVRNQVLERRSYNC